MKLYNFIAIANYNICRSGWKIVFGFRNHISPKMIKIYSGYSINNDSNQTLMFDLILKDEYKGSMIA